MPAVNAELMFQAMKHANADFNQIVYWSRPLNWKNQTLTPNPDTIYVFPFFSTKDVGPLVLEIPPAAEGANAASITGIDELRLGRIRRLRQGIEPDALAIGDGLGDVSVAAADEIGPQEEKSGISLRR
jgi:hypothetical protein